MIRDIALGIVIVLAFVAGMVWFLSDSNDWDGY